VLISPLLVSALCLSLLPAPLLAGPVPRGDAVAGRDKADTERCLECHGTAGEGQGYSNGSDGKFARLDGQHPEYIVKQIEDFRSGRRKHEFMKMMASSISNADLADIAAYFAAAPVREGMPAKAPELFVHGDAARGIAACAGCHGGNGRGIAGAGPVLAGQGRRYLEQQLEEWRSGARSNSAGGVMNLQARPLTDADIAALALYLSQL
jgi:cytochrome c553